MLVVIVFAFALGYRALEQEQTMENKKAAKGVTIVEYAIMLALVAIAVAVAVPSITSAVNSVFSKSSSVMNK
jgi:Flp pilus assembly pilin Flp